MANRASCRRWLHAALFLCFLSFAGFEPARAQEYVEPTGENFIKILVRFGALDLSENENLDLYASEVECKIYQKFSKDDFTWRRVQKALRKSIKQNVVSFPVAVFYDSTLQFERYDFNSKMFRFTEKSAPVNVGFFSYTLQPSPCSSPADPYFPEIFRLSLDQPLTIYGIPMSEQEGKSLLQRMKENDNESRWVPVRFVLKIVSVSPILLKRDRQNGKLEWRFQDEDLPFIRFDAHLVSADFYEDEARTKLIYSYKP